MSAYRFSSSPACRGVIAALVAMAWLNGCAPHRDQIAPLPQPLSSVDHIDVQGARITATPYLDPRQAEAVFGFDIRGAGLLPVSFALDNRSTAVVRINPQQSFLIDLDGQAWPVLSSEQAYNRVARAQEQGILDRGSLAQDALRGGVTGAVSGALTAFAFSVIISHGMGTPMLQGAAAGATLGLLTGGQAAASELSNRVRQEIAGKAFHTHLIQPGEMAYGVLFFPGRNEARTARNLRLSLDLDSYPKIVDLPLKMPPPQPASSR